MSSRRQQALAEARKLVRTFGSAPDPKRRAQAVLSELKHAEAWPPQARREIADVDAWLQTAPSVTTLEPRLRALLTKLA